MVGLRDLICFAVQLYGHGVFTMSRCSALRVMAAVRMYGPRLPNDVTLLGFACEGHRSILCALPRRGDVAMLGSACEGRHSFVCASSPGDVTLCGKPPFNSMCPASRRRHTARLCV